MHGSPGSPVDRRTAGLRIPPGRSSGSLYRSLGRVAELADAQDSGSCVRKDVGVQVPPRPLTGYRQNWAGRVDKTQAASGYRLGCGGTVALTATGAEPALIGAAPDRHFRGAHVFAMHFNTEFSAHLTPCVEWCGSMQQCRMGAYPIGGTLGNQVHPRCTIRQTIAQRRILPTPYGPGARIMRICSSVPHVSSAALSEAAIQRAPAWVSWIKSGCR